MINSKRFKRLSLGIGAGIRFESGSRFRPYIPVFLDIRTRFVPRRISPFIALGCGYTFHPHYNGGLYLSPSLGISFKLGRRFGMHLALSYELLGYRSRYMDLDDGYIFSWFKKHKCNESRNNQTIYILFFFVICRLCLCPLSLC